MAANCGLSSTFIVNYSSNRQFSNCVINRNYDAIARPRATDSLTMVNQPACLDTKSTMIHE